MNQALYAHMNNKRKMKKKKKRKSRNMNYFQFGRASEEEVAAIKADRNAKN
jgi:hypothetical protein